MSLCRIAPHTIAALAVTVGAIAAMPSAAHAGKVQLIGGVAEFAGGGEGNHVGLSKIDADTVEFTDVGATMTVGSGCSHVALDRVRCHRFGGIRRASVHLGDGFDTFRMLDGAIGSTGFPVRMFGNGGPDTYYGNSTRQPTAVEISGGDSSDTVRWSDDPFFQRQGVDLHVFIVKNDPLGNDGRFKYDQNAIADDVESVHGTRFDDLIVGSDDSDVQEFITPGRGNDTVDGRLGLETVIADETPDGADRVVGGRDGAMMTYAARTSPLSVVLNDGAANDGASGEGDSLNEILKVIGGRADDTLIAAGPGAPGAVTELHGFFGNDALFGTNGPDVLEGHDGTDRMFGNGGNDTLLHYFRVGRDDDLKADTIDGGTGVDLALAGTGDQLTGVEQRLVGKVTASATRRGFTVTWRHPVSWRKLRSLEVALRDPQGSTMGRLTVRPHGGVELHGVRASVRVSHDGKAATARVKLGHSPAYAGRKVALDVTATDVNGRRQLATNVAALRLR